MKPWQTKCIQYAAEVPDASFAALARWCDVHKNTLYRARRDDPDFAKSIEDARAGVVTSGDIAGIEQFVRDPDYLGLGVRGVDENGTIYPRVLEHLKIINEGDFSLGIMVGGIGSAKTYVSVISLVYQLYLLLSLDDPHTTLKLDPASPIIIVLQNRNERLAKLNAYALFRNFVERCKWFQQQHPHDDRLKARIKFLKRNVEVWPIGGDAAGVLGMNVYGGMIDEANFHDITAKSKRSVSNDRIYDAGRESFEGLIRRRLSRLDEDKGCLFVSSSRRYHGELTSQLIDEYGTDPRTYIFSETAWSIRPEAYADGKWFDVFIGDQTRQPRILAEDEEVHPRDRDLVVRVPHKFRRQFISNTTRSLQDLAGVSLVRVGSYFTDRGLLNDAARGENVLMATDSVTADATLLYPGQVHIADHESPRAVHCDLSLSGDSTGVCVAHIAGFDNEGRQLIVVDGLGLVRPPRHGQIDLNSVYELVRRWKSSGVPIEYFSCDQFQSSDLLQRVARLGIRTGRLSVDMTSHENPLDAYEVLRCAVAESRIIFPRNQTVVDELLALELDRKRNRIDHPPGGSKDLADALAGAVFQLSRLKAWQLIDRVKGATLAAARNHTPLQSTITSVRAPSLGARGVLNLYRASKGLPERF